MTDDQDRTLDWMRATRPDADPVEGAVLVALGEEPGATHAILYSDGTYRVVKLGTIHPPPKNWTGRNQI